MLLEIVVELLERRHRGCNGGGILVGEIGELVHGRNHVGTEHVHIHSGGKIGESVGIGTTETHGELLSHSTEVVPDIEGGSRHGVGKRIADAGGVGAHGVQLLLEVQGVEVGAVAAAKKAAADVRLVRRSITVVSMRLRGVAPTTLGRGGTHVLSLCLRFGPSLHGVGLHVGVEGLDLLEALIAQPAMEEAVRRRLGAFFRCGDSMYLNRGLIKWLKRRSVNLHLQF